MMIKEINTNKLFRDLEEVKGFYNLDAYDLEEIEESLKDAEFEVIEKFEVEYTTCRNSEQQEYFNTLEEAKERTEELLQDSREAHRLSEEEFSKYIDNENVIKTIQINEWDENGEHEIIEDYEVNKEIVNEIDELLQFENKIVTKEEFEDIEENCYTKSVENYGYSSQKIGYLVYNVVFADGREVDVYYKEEEE